MPAEKWQKVEELLDAALELEPVARARFVAAVEDTELRREIESLLACEKQADGFLAASALAFSADFFAAGDGSEDRAGQTIGRYRIIREIGRGGMGAVYLAERSDGEFQQQVALKVVRRSFAETELVRRFRQERQILASLNHPNIARLLDGGVSADGEPFLAMEYVEGARIDDYAEAHHLSTDARLSLFRQVCAGVQYAHQNLIIHRDLKPSNILVTKDGAPKLLDFGIAKLLDAQQTGEHTRTEMRAYTPDFASPEQISGAPVTTPSDVYSLGVLLRDLLKGKSPTPKGSPAGVELENIVAMARREDPARRYASAAQLAEDVQRYLDGLPVKAQKDSFSYRASKFVKRNKAGAAAAAVIMLTIVGGIIATVWQARLATRAAQVAAQERDRARVEAAKAERINAFLQSLFASANPNWYSSGYGQRGEVKVVDVLEQAGRRIDTDFKDQPEIRAELHHTIGTTYQALGRSESAKAHFRAAVDAYRGLYGERHPEVAEALYYLGASMSGGYDVASALVLYRQSLEMFRQVDPNNANVPYLLADMAHALDIAGETWAAEQAAREGLEIARQRYGDEHVLTTTLLGRLGLIYEARGELDQAESFYQTVLSTFNRMPNGRMHSSGILTDLGRLSMLRGDLKQAEARVRESHNITSQVLNDTHSQSINVLRQLAEIHYLQGAYAEAEKEAKSLLDLLRRVEVRNSSSQTSALSLLSLTHAKTKRHASASAFLREALAVFNSVSGEDKYRDAGLLGEALIAMKREAEARPVVLKRYAFFARTHGEKNPQAILARQQLERLDANKGRS